MRNAHAIAIAIPMIGKFTSMNSERRTCTCFRLRTSRQRIPENDALKAILNAPKLTPIAML